MSACTHANDSQLILLGVSEPGAARTHRHTAPSSCPAIPAAASAPADGRCCAWATRCRPGSAPGPPTASTFSAADAATRPGRHRLAAGPLCMRSKRRRWRKGPDGVNLKRALRPARLAHARAPRLQASRCHRPARNARSHEPAAGVCLRAGSAVAVHGRTRGASGAGYSAPASALSRAWRACRLGTDGAYAACTATDGVYGACTACLQQTARTDRMYRNRRGVHGAAYHHT